VPAIRPIPSARAAFQTRISARGSHTRLFGKLLLGVELSSFLHSFADNLKPWDLGIGLIKASVFGLSIAITSCHFGVNVKGGAVGVGRAVNDAVVSAAVAIMISDNLLTMLLR